MRTLWQMGVRRTLALVLDAIRKASMRAWVRRPPWTYWFDAALLVYWITATVMDVMDHSWWEVTVSGVLVYLHFHLVVLWPWRGLRQHKRLTEERSRLVAEHVEYIEKMYGKDEDGGLGRSGAM